MVLSYLNVNFKTVTIAFKFDHLLRQWVTVIYSGSLGQRIYLTSVRYKPYGGYIIFLISFLFILVFLCFVFFFYKGFVIKYVKYPIELQLMILGILLTFGIPLKYISFFFIFQTTTLSPYTLTMYEFKKCFIIITMIIIIVHCIVYLPQLLHDS